MQNPKKVTAIVKVTENCNYNCRFCYYAYNKNSIHKNMSIDMCKDIIRKVVEYNISNNYYICSIIFHGGEPLLRGLDFFDDIINYQHILKKKYPKIVFDNTIQTNGYLINDDWIDFFKKNNFIVGISLDGDGEQNYHLSEKKSTDDIIKAYHKMCDLGINVGILSVITNKHCNDVVKFYNFIKNNDIKKISILPCVNDDGNYTVDNEKLVCFYKNFFDLYFNSDYQFCVREFDGLIKRILGYNARTCKNCHRIGCGSFITFDSLGNVFFCDEAYNKDKIICNIKNIEIIDIFSNENYINKKNECYNFYNENCEKCCIKKICAGDCYRNDITNDEGKRINRFCEVSNIVYPYIEKKVLKAIKNEK